MFELETNKQKKSVVYDTKSDLTESAYKIKTKEQCS